MFYGAHGSLLPQPSNGANNHWMNRVSGQGPARKPAFAWRPADSSPESLAGMLQVLPADVSSRGQKITVKSGYPYTMDSGAVSRSMAQEHLTWSELVEHLKSDDQNTRNFARAVMLGLTGKASDWGAGSAWGARDKAMTMVYEPPQPLRRPQLLSQSQALRSQEQSQVIEEEPPEGAVSLGQPVMQPPVMGQPVSAEGQRPQREVPGAVIQGLPVAQQNQLQPPGVQQELQQLRDEIQRLKAPQSNVPVQGNWPPPMYWPPHMYGPPAPIYMQPHPVQHDQQQKIQQLEQEIHALKQQLSQAAAGPNQATPARGPDRAQQAREAFTNKLADLKKKEDEAAERYKKSAGKRRGERWKAFGAGIIAGVAGFLFPLTLFVTVPIFVHRAYKALHHAADARIAKRQMDQLNAEIVKLRQAEELRLREAQPS